MKNSKAQPIFSPKKISEMVDLIKRERPDLWKLWKELEDSESEDRYREMVDEVRKLIKSANITNDLVETSALLRSIRRLIRLELGFFSGVQYEKEKVFEAAELIKATRPDLWEQWKGYERNGQSYVPIRKNLLEILEKFLSETNSVKIQGMLNLLRHLVLVESGVWSRDDI
jgi:hypothetical protein